MGVGDLILAFFSVHNLTSSYNRLVCIYVVVEKESLDQASNLGLILTSLFKSLLLFFVLTGAFIRKIDLAWLCSILLCFNV